MGRTPDAPAVPLRQRLEDARRRRRRQGLERRRRVLEPLGDQQVRVDGRVLTDFSSNDYLGLARREVRGPAGSGASPLVSGHRPEHRALEKGLAAFLDRDSVLLCGSGYAANLAVATALAGRGDTIVQDRLCHASLIDGARLSGAALRRYAHGDPEAARARLARAPGLRLLVTDGVFSMDGDAAPLDALARVAGAEEASLVVDDAHGIGVLGERGAGLCDALGLGLREVPVLVGTLGKAFGSAGAFVAGDRHLIQHLENHARSVIYSTAPAPAQASAALDALHRLQSEPSLRERLFERIGQFRDGAAERGIPLGDSRTPIQPLVLGEPAAALAFADWLETQGFMVVAIRPPTVPRGTSRLRITLSSGHTAGQVEGLLDALTEGFDRGKDAAESSRS